jgi:hypothetical protein
LVEFIEANELRVIAFNEYVNDAGDEVSVVQVHPDAASMEAHMEIVRERARAAYALTRSTRLYASRCSAGRRRRSWRSSVSKQAAGWRSGSTGSTSGASPAQEAGFAQAAGGGARDAGALAGAA